MNELINKDNEWIIHFMGSLDRMLDNVEHLTASYRPTLNGELFQEPPDRVEPEEPPPGRVPHGARQGIRFEPSGFLLHGAGRRHGGRPRSRGFEEGGRTACGVLRVAVHERRAVRFAAGQGRPSGRHPFRKRVLEGGGNPLHFRSCSAPARQMGIRTRFQTPSAGGCTGLPG